MVLNMSGTQPKKRTRIENFTPSVAKQIIVEKKEKEEDKYGVTAIMQELILKNMDTSRTSFDIYVSTMIHLVRKEHPRLSDNYICKLCDNVVDSFRTQGWIVTYHLACCYDQFDDGKASHWKFAFA